MGQGLKIEWISEIPVERSWLDSDLKFSVSVMDELFLSKAIQVIERHMNETGFSAEKFRKEIGISRSHLHRRLKSLTNRSTTDFIRSFRLKKAAELLIQRVATVSEIAYDTGFNNLSYFTCCFKKEFGVVPSEYFIKKHQLNTF
jgi:AraC-like DNA-binding protein